MRVVVVSLLALLLVLPAACDVAPAVGCDFQNGSANGPEPRCQSREGADSGALAATCDALGGETIDGGCDTSTSLGGCNVSEGNVLTTVIDWYYPPLTAEEAAAECAESGGSWSPL